MNAIKQFDQKALAAALASISKGAIKTRDAIQEVAVWAVVVSIKHAEIGVANSLLDALGGTKSIRKDSLVAYFEKFGHMMWNPSEKKMARFDNARTGCKKGVLTDAWSGTILATKWDEAKKEGPIVSEYDMEKQLGTFLERMEKLTLDPSKKIVNMDTLQAVRNAFNRIGAEKTLRGMKIDQDVLDTSAAQQAAFDAKQGTPLPVIVAPQLQAA